MKNIPASLTLLITGPSGTNVDKNQLARQFIDSYDEVIKESPSELAVFTNGIAVPLLEKELQFHRVWDEMKLAGNVTTVIVTTLGIDEMNTDHLFIMQRLLKTMTPLIIIEFGAPSTQTRNLLDETVTCSSSGHIAIDSPNVIYFCNSASMAMIPSLQIDDVHYIEPLRHNKKLTVPSQSTIWPWFFVSASKQHRHHSHHHEHHHEHHHRHHGHYHHHHGHHFDEDVDEIVDQIMEEIVEQGSGQITSEPVKEPSEYEKKLSCKYRKSCYESGVVPEIDNVFTSLYNKWWPHWLEESGKEQKEEEDIAEEYDAEADITPQKVRCKYRISCYHDHGIPYDEKAEERRKVLLSSKRVVQDKGPKKTLKEIAAHTLKMVQEAGEKAAKRPAVKVVQARLDAIEEKLNEKLNCKYRKSCYETGQQPVIADTWSLPLPINIFSTESAEAATKEINYDELEELEKKVYCKYRKSCYETGIKPDIEPEIFVRTFRDLFTIHEQVEPRIMSLQEKCKYRKSCYETGIVPEINPHLEAAIHKEVSPVIPTNAQDLRLLCKYRKSCYNEIHDSATVDTIKFIRKRRQIEKEVRRRRAKRAKLHRRLRGELQLGTYRGRHHRRNKTKEEEELEEPGEMEVEYTFPMKERSEEIKEKQEEASGSKPSKYRKTKQQQQEQADSGEKEAVEEPVVVSTTEEEKEDKPQVKKVRKGKKAKPQEPKVDKKIEKREEKEKDKKKEDVMAEEKPVTKKKEEVLAEEKPVISKQKKKKEIEPSPKDSAVKQKKKEGKEQKQDDAEQAAYARQSGSKQYDTVAAGMKKMMEDVHHHQEEQQKKEQCKYRKSCYQTGKKPKIDQTLKHLLEKPVEDVDKEAKESKTKEKQTKERETKEKEAKVKETEERETKEKETKEKETEERETKEETKERETDAALLKLELSKKLQCKYRKSCYETGILPETVVPHYFYNDQKIVFKAGVSKQLQCKYRKSCYAETGLFDEEDLKDVKEKLEPAVKKVAGQEAKRIPVSEKESEDKDGTKRSLKSAQTTAGPASLSSDKETRDIECKSGGKSCYSSAEPQAIHEDHAGSMARIGLERYRKNGWCNKYYYSCREILGLPPKERAPIGPNGKRLCRKKPL
nr:Protein T12D8.9, isoform b [Haemonchus contortus]